MHTEAEAEDVLVHLLVGDKAPAATDVKLEQVLIASHNLGQPLKAKAFLRAVSMQRPMLIAWRAACFVLDQHLQPLDLQVAPKMRAHSLLAHVKMEDHIRADSITCVDI